MTDEWADLKARLLGESRYAETLTELSALEAVAEMVEGEVPTQDWRTVAGFGKFADTLPADSVALWAFFRFCVDVLGSEDPDRSLLFLDDLELHGASRDLVSASEVGSLDGVRRVVEVMDRIVADQLDAADPGLPDWVALSRASRREVESHLREVLEVEALENTPEAARRRMALRRKRLEGVAGVQLPAALFGLAERLSKEARAFRVRQGRPPTVQELADACELPLGEVASVYLLLRLE